MEQNAVLSEAGEDLLQGVQTVGTHQHLFRDPGQYRLADHQQEDPGSLRNLGKIQLMVARGVEKIISKHVDPAPGIEPQGTGAVIEPDNGDIFLLNVKDFAHRKLFE